MNTKVEIGKRVEVKYAITAQTMGYLHKALAVSVRYISADYVPQPATPATQIKVPETPANPAGVNTFTGTIMKGASTFDIPPYYKFTAVADNGESKEFYIPRGGKSITDIDGKLTWGAPPKKGKKMEVRYSSGEGGRNITVSMRYVSPDYIPQPTASTAPLEASSEKTAPVQITTSQAGDIFEGKVEAVTKMLPRPPYWRFGALKVIAASGEKREMDIMDSTVVMDSSGRETGKARSAWNLKNGQHVVVTYWPAANIGHDKAVSIRCLD